RIRRSWKEGRSNEIRTGRVRRLQKRCHFITTSRRTLVADSRILHIDDTSPRKSLDPMGRKPGVRGKIAVQCVRPAAKRGVQTEIAGARGTRSARGRRIERRRKRGWGRLRGCLGFFPG